MTRRDPNETEMIKISALHARQKNPNHMEPADFELLKNAIKRVGFLQPVLVRPEEDGTFEIVDGAHRVQAAKACGLTEVPCVVRSLDGATAEAVQIGMNKIRGELDLADVAAVIADLHLLDWSREDITLTGFSVEEIDALLKTSRGDEDVLAGSTATEPDLMDEPPPKPFLLEVEFASRDDLVRVKKAIKRAAAGGELSDGLLAIIGD